MNKTTKLRALMLSLMMLIGLLPLTSFAQQRNDDFFRVDDSFNGNRDPLITWTIVNNGIGQSEAPVGSGLLILFAVGAGYAITRRKRNLKKVATLFLALVLTLNLTNCRKNLETINSVPSNGVYITLNVDGGSRVIVDPTGHTDPNYATVTFEDKDVIYVGNNGAYCGYLEYDGSTNKFGGTITPTGADDADYLHFYFMGNKGAKSEPTSVYITDQTSKYPVISYGRSESLYHSSTTEYSATLYNKCAIGKFTISGVDTDKAITITGMKNTVAVDFSKNGTGGVVNPYTYSKTGSGEIRLHAESNTERWAILLPQDEVTTATAYASGYTTTSAFTVPAVSANGYYDSGVAVAMASGSPKGAFTINASGDQVFFAPGNLQYQASTSTWRFAEHQWYYVGDATNGNVYVGEVKSNNALIASDYSGWIDLFCWGTSGYNHGAIEYQPYSTSNNAKNHYAYGIYTYNLYDQTGQADWGYAASAASLGGNSTWRTLKNEEWVYVFNTRITSSGMRYTKGKSVNGIPGIVLYPDSYTGSEYSGSNWSTFESNGCVFLPKAGYRAATTLSSVSSEGYYWSSSYGDNDVYAYSVKFINGLTTSYGAHRQRGYAVRLVRPIE